MTAHSELGGSIAKRFLRCPGCVRMCRDLPPSPSSPASERGTAMHEAAALCITGGHNSVEMIGRTFNAIEIDEDMADDILIHVDRCNSHPGEMRLTEHQFTLADLNPPIPMFGTADSVVYDAATGTLYVDDLKTGYREVVADDNAQLKYYALGAMLSLAHLPVKRVVGSIVQPRKGGVKETEFEPYELVEWADTLMAAAHATQAPDAPLVAGPHCDDTFCPAAGLCVANANHALTVAQAEFAEFDTFTPPAPETLTAAERGQILNRADEFEAWLKSVRAYTSARLAEGEDPELSGWKNVETIGRETWIDKAKAAEAASGAVPLYLHLSADQLYAPRKALSSAQARGVLQNRIYTAGKLAGKKITKKAAETEARAILAPLVHRPKTGTALVPVSDSRPALAGGGSEFTALPAEEE